ncbi:MAG: FAD-dependent oxidoreductase [Verrucomicrobiota bacterium]
MKRAVILVRTAAKKKVFKEYTPLLIIGGGVSGLAAALEAAKQNIFVTLIESERELFSVQRKCTTRYLHPHEYDWPLSHYREPAFPYSRKDESFTPLQMHWRAGIAADVVEKMANQITSSTPPKLNLRIGEDHIPVSLDTLRSKFDPRDEFEFILICAGGQEDTQLGKFTGFKYWDQDPLEKLSSLGSSKKVNNVLISGGGDGGLQDFLRIINDRKDGKPFSAGILLDRFLPTLKLSPEFVEWIGNKQNDCRAFRPSPEVMWREFSKLLDSIEKNSKCWKPLRNEVLASVNLEVINKERIVQLVFKGRHFSNSFALNAFLVLLVARVMKQQKCLRPNCCLDQIVSVSKRHRCSGSAVKCCGKLHEVSYKPTRSGAKRSERFDLIVLRYGSKPTVSPALRKE